MQKFPFISTVSPDVWLQQAFALHQQGQLGKARALYEKVLAHQPRHSQALYLLGTLALQARDLRLAESMLGRAAIANPRHVPTLINLAMSLSQLDQHEQALDRINRALELEPASMPARTARLGMLVRASRASEALQLFDELMANGVQSAELWVNKGIAHIELGAPELAEQCFDHVLSLAPQHRDALSQKVKLLISRKQYAQALELTDRCIAAMPDDAQAYANRGHALIELKRCVEAVGACERACALEPTVDRWAKLATALCSVERVEEAEAAIEKARALDPEHPPLWVAAGHLLAKLGEHSSAVLNFDRFLAVRGKDNKVLMLKAVTLLNSGAYQQARDVLALCDGSDSEAFLSSCVYVCLMLADWRDLQGRVELLLSDVRAGRGVHAPFTLLAVVDDAALMRSAAQTWARDGGGDTAGQNDVVVPPRGKKLRIGYFSADFHHHATCMLMAEVFASHDRDQFELFGFSFGLTGRDAMTERVADSFDHFDEVRSWSTERIVAQARRYGLDIAVDLKGYTQQGRPALFAQGCAPIQVSYLGYPGTLGMPCMDYIIADRVVIPPEHEVHYTEKVVRMPHSYQCNDSQRAIASRSFTRQELDLPDSGFVFVCFNNNYKILPEVFARWMKILQATPYSVLWLYEGNAGCAENLRSHARAAGVDPTRLVFAPHMPADQHLARLKHADLFLDTLPCNAHTTASDALWAGVPLLTCLGNAFQGRVAASLLRALSLDELVTTNLDAYEAEAIALAHSPERLDVLRTKLAHQRHAAPLFDGRRFARHLESAYRTMVERHDGGLPPASFDVIDRHAG
jgi:predicted O-linked N-acetylglucosamine transferase (SPINDLY family)